MREFAGAIQPYAHYSRSLAQWQLRLHRLYDAAEPNADLKALIGLGPRAYDPQKATRITLFHALLNYILGRIWIASHDDATESAATVTRLGDAIGRCRYLDGQKTAWAQQFWEMVWERDGGTILEWTSQLF
jgi:hypothetical protein